MTILFPGGYSDQVRTSVHLVGAGDSQAGRNNIPAPGKDIRAGAKGVAERGRVHGRQHGARRLVGGGSGRRPRGPSFHEGRFRGHRSDHHPTPLQAFLAVHRV